MVQLSAQRYRFSSLPHADKVGLEIRPVFPEGMSARSAQTNAESIGGLRAEVQPACIQSENGLAASVLWAPTAATLCRLEVPDSHIILMLADDMACNPRNPQRPSSYYHPNHVLDLYSKDIQVDYRGFDVTVGNFLSVLTGKHT